jgi:hypothetical protein
LEVKIQGGSMIRPWEDKMRIRKSFLVIAAGAMLAAASGAYAAPQYRRDGFEDRNVRSAEAMERQGDNLIRRGEQLERSGYSRRGEYLENQGRRLKAQAEQRERSGRYFERRER